MQVNVLQLVLLGFIINNARVRCKEKVHIKIHIPELIKHHHHTKIVFIKKKGGGGGGHHHGPAKKVHHVVHKHEHSHKHKHDHGHKHGHKHAAKHGHKHEHKGQHKHTHFVTKLHDHKKHHHHELAEPAVRQRHRTERFNYESVESPRSPVRVHGSYKVSERDPFDSTTRGYHQQYQYPPVGPADGYGRLYERYKARDEERFNSNALGEEAVPEGGDVHGFGDYDYAPPTETQSYEGFEYEGPEGSGVSEQFGSGPERKENGEYGGGESFEVLKQYVRPEFASDSTSLERYLAKEYGGQEAASDTRPVGVRVDAAPASGQKA